MAHRVCPWWLGYWLVVPLRRWYQDPRRLLAPYVRAGMTVIEPGPGMGFFTLDLARLVGPEGRVVAIDVQPRMVGALRRRAERAGLGERIQARECREGHLGLRDIEGAADFALAFAVVHEVPAAEPFFKELFAAMKPGGVVLFVEPAGHVAPDAFLAELESAAAAGFAAEPGPPVRGSIAAVLTKAA